MNKKKYNYYYDFNKLMKNANHSDKMFKIKL